MTLVFLLILSTEYGDVILEHVADRAICEALIDEPNMRCVRGLEHE